MARAREIDHKLDGTEHLNIYSKAATDLGKQLSHFAHTPFCHKEFGNFASMEGFWYWLTRQDDSLRHLHGWEAKQRGQDLPEVKKYHPERFRQLIMEGNDAKLQRHPEILEALGKTTQRLEHYYVQRYGKDTKVQHARDSEWLLAYFEGARKKLNPEADMFHSEKIERRLKAAQAEPDQLTMF